MPSFRFKLDLQFAKPRCATSIQRARRCSKQIPPGGFGNGTLDTFRPPHPPSDVKACQEIIEQLEVILLYACGRCEPQRHPAAVPFFAGLSGRADAPFGSGRRERGHRIRWFLSGSASEKASRRGCGSGNCSNWPTKPAWKFPSATSRWAPASGAKSNTDCSHASARTGGGKPLISHEVIINLIAGATTAVGLAVRSKLDTNIYPAGLNVFDQQMAEQLRRHKFHGDWNYSLLPKSL